VAKLETARLASCIQQCSSWYGQKKLEASYKSQKAAHVIDLTLQLLANFPLRTTEYEMAWVTPLRCEAGVVVSSFIVNTLPSSVQI